MGRCRTFCKGKMVFVVFTKKEWASNQLVRRGRLKYVSCDGERLVLEMFFILQNVYFWCCTLSPFSEYPPKHLIFRMCRWQREIST